MLKAALQHDALGLLPALLPEIRVRADRVKALAQRAFALLLSDDCRARGDGSEALSDKELEKRIRAVDKARAQYYRFYTGESHDDRMTYDLGINTSTIAIPDAVAAIAALVSAQN